MNGRSEPGLEALIALLDPHPGERILDAGCGIGEAAKRLAARGAHVTGIDIQAPLIGQARIAVPQAHFLCGDLMHHQPAEPYDAIFARALLDWLPACKPAAQQLARLLRSGGRLAADVGSSLAMMDSLAAVAGALRCGPGPRPPAAPAQWKEALEAAGLGIVFCSVRPDEAAQRDGIIRLLARKI